MKQPVFVGSSAAIVTPFDKNQEINLKELERLIERQIENKTSAITICGTTGEASTLSLEEKNNILKFTCEVVDKRIPIIAGTGSNDTNQAKIMSKLAEKHGCQAVLLVTPYYNKTNQTGLFHHFDTIANSVNIPSILYNVPSRTGISISAETYYKLSKNPKINGVKEASGDFSLVAKTISMCEDNLNIWSGNDDQIVAMMALGAKGVISVLANIIPEIVSNITSSCMNNDFKNATKLQSDYLNLSNTLFCDVNPIPVKTAMKLMGFDVGGLRLPLYDMSQEEQDHLRLILDKTKLINGAK